MAHKVHPFIFRIKTTKQWPSRWFARNQAYRDHLREDLSLRAFFQKELKEAALNRVDIERSRGSMTITLHTAKPGVVIGRSGTGIEDLKKKMLKTFYPATAKTVNVHLSVQEVSRPGLEAVLVMQGMIMDLERRMAFRRVLKTTIERARKAGALGAKVCVSGRLNGAEIARTEKLAWGKIPLTNLRADIDYSQGFAKTMAGTIGVKVWIYRGDVFEQDRLSQYTPNTPARPDRRSGSDRRDNRYNGPRGFVPLGSAPTTPSPATSPSTAPSDAPIAPAPIAS